jgi:hypothetical protein
VKILMILFSFVLNFVLVAIVLSLISNFIYNDGWVNSHVISSSLFGAGVGTVVFAFISWR